LERCLNPECVNLPNCQKSFRQSFGKISDSIRSDDIQDVFDTIRSEFDIVQKKIQEVQDTKCWECYSNLENELILLWKNIEKIAGKTLREEALSYDVDKLVRVVFKPLSHPIRLRILVELGKGSAGFSDLSGKTGTRGGHLLFHLDQLLESGLVVQNRNKGNYVITSRGIDILSMLGNIVGT
jgi:DNA-binding transcriptional ArsR family regulator